MKSENAGKAFEYACVMDLYTYLKDRQEVLIEESPQYRTAKGFFEGAPENIKENMRKAASAATRAIVRLEPQLEFGTDGRLTLSLQPDAAGMTGDVRDVLCVRASSGWEIGISCKHNHMAVKHSRLSATIDFGEKWMGIPCSQQYFDVIVPIFDELAEIRKESNATALWEHIGSEKATRYYIPVLDAFMNEMDHLYQVNPEVPERLVHYLIGFHDFYKVIARDNFRYTQIDAVNIHGTLNQPAGGRAPLTRIPLLDLPDKIYDMDYAPGSDNKIHVVLNKGWEISMRIHNASSRVEPSLKFDVNLISLPHSIFSMSEPW